MEVPGNSTRLSCSSSGLPTEDCALALIDDITCGLYNPLSKMITEQANQWFPLAEADADAETTCNANDTANDTANNTSNDDSRTTNGSNLSHSADCSDGIDVSADLNEIERGQYKQAALLRELAQTKEQLLQGWQENKTTTNKRGGKGGLFKVLRLGGGRASSGSGSNGKDKENNPNNNTTTTTNNKQSSTKSRRILSLSGRGKRGSAGKNKNNLNSSSGTCTADYSNDRTVLAVVNDSGVDLVNLTLQREDANSTTEAVDISSSTDGSGGSANSSIDLVLVSELALGVILTGAGLEAPSSKEAAPTSKEAASTNVTVEDPTFVLEISSIDDTAPSFAADADVVKDPAGEKQPQPTNTIPSTTGGGSTDDDGSLPDRSEFVTPVANLLERVYGAETFGGEERWVRANLILDTYKGREDALIQSLLVKAAEREARQKKAPKQRNDTSTRSAAATPADSFNLDVSSIVVVDEDVDAITSSPETAPPAPIPPQGPSKADLSFRDIPVLRPFEEDAGIGSGNEEFSPSEEIDTTGDSTAAVGYDVVDDDSLFDDLERNNAEAVDNAAPSSLSAPTTDSLSSNVNISSPPSKSEHVATHGTSMQSDESSAFDFGQFATSNPFQNLNEKDTENETTAMPSSPCHPPISSEEQFGYMHTNQRRAGRASTRLRSILQEPKSSTNAIGF